MTAAGLDDVLSAHPWLRRLPDEVLDRLTEAERRWPGIALVEYQRP